MSKHTPGPWTADANLILGPCYKDKNGAPCRSIVARVQSRKVADNNARLLAAAPEMLAALKHVYSILPSETLYKIIQKAEGNL